jgi:hypothetical protein
MTARVQERGSSVHFASVEFGAGRCDAVLLQRAFHPWQHQILVNETRIVQDELARVEQVNEMEALEFGLEEFEHGGVGHLGDGLLERPRENTAR